MDFLDENLCSWSENQTQKMSRPSTYVRTPLLDTAELFLVTFLNRYLQKCISAATEQELPTVYNF